MNNLTVTIPHVSLRAFAKYIAPKTDVRFYLIGVHVVGKRGADHLRIEATDGHCLMIQRIDVSEPLTDDIDTIIPKDMIETAGKVKSSGKVKSHYVNWEITVRSGDPGSMVSELTIDTLVGSKSAGQSIDGKFPNFSQVVPKELSNEWASFNPSIVARMNDCVKMIDNFYMVHIRYNGRAGALVTVDSDNSIFGAIMPMRITLDHLLSAPPAWFIEDTRS